MKRVIITIAAATALILIGGCVTICVTQSKESSSFYLSDASYGVSVFPVEHPEEPQIPMIKLREMSEQELVDSCGLIVRGTVKNIQNIRLTADGVDYHFGDGRRCAFLNTDNRLLYADWAYPSLQADTLDDVQAYLSSFGR